MTLKVVGAGLARTGTASLKLALEQLLGGPCYHMLEVFANPAHIPVWHRAAQGQLPSWNSFLDGYRAAVDLPASAFWQETCCAISSAVRSVGTLVEFEVDIIRLRTIEGMARARQRGKLKGKQPKLNGQQRAHLLQLDREGKRTPTELFGVSRATIYPELKKAQEAAA